MNMHWVCKWSATAVILASCAISARSEVLLGWDVVGYPSSPIPVSAPSVYNNSALTASTLTRGSGLGAAGGTNGFSANSWTMPVNTTIAEAIASNDYFTFTAVALPGATFDVTNFAWNTVHSSTGPSNFVLRSSVDGFAADLALFVVTNKDNNPISVSTALSLVGQTSVEFRIYGYGASASAGSARLANGGDLGLTGLDMALFGTSTGGFIPTNVQFASSSASMAESIATYTVTVYKTLASGNVSGNVALSGTATEGGGNDYTVDTTNFTMNGAATSATFVVTVNNDTNTEPAETVILTLANVTGGTVAAPSAFTLTITDDDVPSEVPEGIAAFRFSADPHLKVSTKDANITVTDMSLGTGTIETNVTTGTYFPNEPYVEETGGWAVDNQASAKSFRFTLTPNVGYQVSITGISFRAYATDAGPSAMGYDIGGAASFAFDATNQSLITVSQVVSGVDNQAGGIFIQIQGWTNGTRQSSGTGAFRLDDVVVFGTVTPAGDTPPVLAAIGNKSILTNSPLVFTVAATPTDGDTVTLSVSNALPVGAAFGSTNENGAFEWLAPGPVGVYTMTFYAADNDGADSEQITITVTSTPAPPAPLNLNVWINELHYDNAGTDIDEGVEIAGPAGTDLSLYQVYWYDGDGGSPGSPYATQTLSGVIDNELGSGFGAVWFQLGDGTNEVQNTTDGLALVYNSTGVIQFLSYEGSFTAVSGPANGLTSTDIGVEETSTTLVGDSLQLCGNGTNYAAFTWNAPSAHSRDSLNACQTIPSGDPNDTDGDDLPNDWESLYFASSTAANPGDDDDGDGSPNIDEFVAQTIPVLPTGATSYFRNVSLNAGTRAVGYPSVTGRQYRLWSSTNLVPGTDWTQVAGPQAGDGLNQNLQDPANRTSTYYRLTVEMINP